MLRIAVLASGRGGNLQAIIRHMAQGHIHARIVKVLSNMPDAPALDVARGAGIPVWAQSHKDFADRAAFDLAMLAELRACQTDAVVLAGYMRILSPAFIHAFSGKILNIHPSLLPAFPGTDGGGDTLAYGAKFAGCTVHIVVEDLDAGPIVIQAALPVREGDTRDSLMPRIHTLEHRIYPQAIQWLAANRLRVKGRVVHLLPPEKRDSNEPGYETVLRFASSPFAAPDPLCTEAPKAVASSLECLINPPLEEGF